MSTTSPAPYVPYQAYKSKRHSRVLSNPTPPPEASNLNVSVGAGGGVNGIGASEIYGRTRHVSSSSADLAFRVVNGESGVKAASAAAKGDVALSSVNLNANTDDGDGDGDASAGATSFVNENVGLKSGLSSVVVFPASQELATTTAQRRGKEKDGISSSEPTSPSASVDIRLNGGPPDSNVTPNGDVTTEPSSPTSVQSVPVGRTSSNDSQESSSSGNGKQSTISSTSSSPSRKSAGKAPETSAGPSSSSSPSTPSSPTSAKSGSLGIHNPRRTSTFRYVSLRPPNAGSSSTTPRTSSPLRPTSTIQPHANAHNRASSTSGLSPLASARQLGDQPSPASIHSELAPDSTTAITARSTARSKPVSANGNVHHRSTSMMVTPSAALSPFQSPSSGLGLASQRINPPQRTSSLHHPAPNPPPKQSISPSLSSSSGPAPGSFSSTSSRVQSPSPIPFSTPSLSSSSAQTPTSIPSTPTSTSTSIASQRTIKTFYIPGFQPKGVYRPLTDDFLALRKRAKDKGRIEHTRLERRFEKLVELHFAPPPAPPPPPSTRVEGEDASGKGKEKGVVAAPVLARRASSLFEELSELRGKSASELWRSVLESRIASATGGKGDIRVAEQRITPWEEDADVSTCPHCSASFHPLTNRKHHCRLCGRIICSLPVKKPQRPAPCSLLFVSDPKTGRIEEVTEGVDYGVKPRARVDSNAGKSASASASGEDKSLKGVRICRECKPVMLRQQYRQEAKRVPAMVRLYDVLVSLESEIEELLPHFQELMLNLSNNPDEAPTKEASAARKHLLECFADYDAIAKRIRKIPCPGGPGSSQDRVQAAIQARASMFLQKNMFPLQSLPKPKKRSSSSSSTKANGDATGSQGQGQGTDGSASSPSQVIDPDSELAQALQPLLEQEALLESFVEEATTHRKFEDAKTLKANLCEIRAEIDRIVVQAEGG